MLRIKSLLVCEWKTITMLFIWSDQVIIIYIQNWTQRHRKRERECLWFQWCVAVANAINRHELTQNRCFRQIIVSIFWKRERARFLGKSASLYIGHMEFLPTMYEYAYLVILNFYPLCQPHCKAEFNENIIVFDSILSFSVGEQESIDDFSRIQFAPLISLEFKHEHTSDIIFV